MPIKELENNSESAWVKVFANIMWQVGIGNLMAQEKTFNCSEISLTISGINIKVTNSLRFMF